MAKKTFDINSSIADLMTGMMFLFIIALVAYMLNFNDKHSQENQLSSQMRDTNYLTADFVRKLSKFLKSAGVAHTVSEKKGVIAFTEESVAFLSGGASIKTEQANNLASIKVILESLVPCYLDGGVQRFFNICQPYMKGQLDSIVIEGHTDNVPIRSKKIDNLDLSFSRAKAFYEQVTSEKIRNLKNSSGNKIFMVLGAGSNQPINDYSVPTSDSENRRIELRFIMNRPWI